MFNLNKIPTLINSKKHGNRYNINQTTKQKIRMDRFSNKKTITFIMNKYNLTYSTITTILKEFN